MTEKRQASQGYIIRILQHFATKLRNITNFVMLFQAVMKFLSRSKSSLDQNFTQKGKGLLPEKNGAYNRNFSTVDRSQMSLFSLKKGSFGHIVRPLGKRNNIVSI